MILVILGTQDKEFPRLLEAIDREIENGTIHEKVIVQAGQTKYTSKNMEVFDFLPEPEFEKLMDEANLIITHGGAGSILSAIKKGKKIIAAPRLAEYHEHHNDHQKQIISEFASQGYILELQDFNKIGKIIEKSKKFKPKKFESNTINMINLIENYIDSSNHTAWYHRYRFILSYSLINSVITLLLYSILFYECRQSTIISLGLSIGISFLITIGFHYKRINILQLFVYSIILIGSIIGFFYVCNSFIWTVVFIILIPILINCVVFRLFFLKNN